MAARFWTATTRASWPEFVPNFTLRGFLFAIGAKEEAAFGCESWTRKERCGRSCSGAVAVDREAGLGRALNFENDVSYGALSNSNSMLFWPGLTSAVRPLLSKLAYLAGSLDLVGGLSGLGLLGGLIATRYLPGMAPSLAPKVDSLKVPSEFTSPTALDLPPSASNVNE